MAQHRNLNAMQKRAQVQYNMEWIMVLNALAAGDTETVVAV